MSKFYILMLVLNSSTLRSFSFSARTKQPRNLNAYKLLVDHLPQMDEHCHLNEFVPLGFVDQLFSLKASYQSLQMFILVTVIACFVRGLIRKYRVHCIVALTRVTDIKLLVTILVS